MKLAIILAVAIAVAQAQDSTSNTASEEKLMKVEGSLKSLEENYLETKGTVDKLAKIKVSGYIQAQWQKTDTMGAANVAGGVFAPNTDQRFMVRRGRLKTTYETPTSKYVLQYDVIPTGLSIKDAYVTMMEPWLKTASFTMGIFDRPFGFEIGYSSSSRESPERARVYQALFPGERDMGAKLELTPTSDFGMLQYLNFKGGVFTGMGPTANEIDQEQDLIGRLGFQAPFYDLNLAVDGGFSIYLGKVLAVNDTLFSMGDTTFLRTLGSIKRQLDRKVMGVDAQLYYDIPVIGGLSLRGEYLWGEVPGTSGSSSPYGAATTPLYTRNVSGWYVMLVQNFGTKLQGVLKYDVYDPNTDIKGNQVKAITPANAAYGALNATDLKYSTLGFGAVFYWDENLRFTLYYDQVKNEKVNALAAANLAAFKNDRKDNVLTFRMQAKF